MSPVFGRQLAFLLLLLQAGIAVITALGAFVAGAAGFPGDAAFGVLQLLMAVVLLGLAAALGMGSRRAARWTVELEVALFLVAAPPALIGLGLARDLGPLAVNLALPLAIAIAVSRSARRPGPFAAERR